MKHPNEYSGYFVLGEFDGGGTGLVGIEDNLTYRVTNLTDRKSNVNYISRNGELKNTSNSHM